MVVFENDFFRVLREPFGEYQTNCYLAISRDESESLIIDPGIGATKWVLENAKNPLAILNTHGHFDHVWSNAELKEALPNVPLLCPYEDAFMLQKDFFNTGLRESKPDILVGAEDSESFKGAGSASLPIVEFDSNTSNLERKSGFVYGGFELEFLCYPGHTPGCSVIVLKHQESPSQKVMFSGDFIFHRSIGRSDFPYSDNATMKASLEAFMRLDEDMLILPGHGGETRIKQEQANIPYWLMRF